MSELPYTLEGSLSVDEAEDPASGLTSVMKYQKPVAVNRLYGPGEDMEYVLSSHSLLGMQTLELGFKADDSDPVGNPGTILQMLEQGADSLAFRVTYLSGPQGAPVMPDVRERQLLSAVWNKFGRDRDQQEIHRANYGAMDPHEVVGGRVVIGHERRLNIVTQGDGYHYLRLDLSEDMKSNLLLPMFSDGELRTITVQVELPTVRNALCTAGGVITPFPPSGYIIDGTRCRLISTNYNFSMEPGPNAGPSVHSQMKASFLEGPEGFSGPVKLLRWCHKETPAAGDGSLTIPFTSVLEAPQGAIVVCRKSSELGSQYLPFHEKFYYPPNLRNFNMLFNGRPVPANPIRARDSENMPQALDNIFAFSSWLSEWSKVRHASAFPQSRLESQAHDPLGTDHFIMVVFWGTGTEAGGAQAPSGNQGLQFQMEFDTPGNLAGYQFDVIEFGFGERVPTRSGIRVDV